MQMQNKWWYSFTKKNVILFSSPFTQGHTTMSTQTS